jgi:two-component system sensor histidine kinase RegB
MHNSAESAVEPPPAPAHTLRQVLLTRSLLLGALALSVVVVGSYFASPLPLAALVTLMALLAIANVATACRMRTAAFVSETEVLAQSLLDVVITTTFFYLCGGATNPFVDLFFLPLATAAASLRGRALLFLCGFMLSCYLLLVKFHVPLLPSDQDPPGFLCVAMWLKYAIIGGFGAWLIHKSAGRLGMSEKGLAQAMQRRHDGSYVARVGTLAASAAHEITSPLCTMSVVANELLHSHADRPDLVESLRLMLGQIDGCRRILSRVTAYAQSALTDHTAMVAADGLLLEVVQRWGELRPAAQLKYSSSGPQPAPLVAVSAGLDHAILNLLNNAADASPGDVEMRGTWSATELRVIVLDRGGGIAPEHLEVLGERVISTKQQGGNGIGLLLTRAAVEAAGGRLVISNRPDGGARAELTVPLTRRAPARASPERRRGRDSTRRYASSAANF